MNTQAILKNDNRFLIVDTLLRSIAEDLDIPPSKYEEAVARYTAVAKWLEGGRYPGTSGTPSIYVQGSFRLGTVVRPLRNGKEAEYDIDLACELRSSPQKLTPEQTKHLVGDRLKEHGTFREMMEDEGRRCWTILYAEADGIGFHLDTLPCLPYPITSEDVEFRYGQQAIALTNRDDFEMPYEWGYSNPNGFADWFADRQSYAFQRSARLRKYEIAAQHPEVYASIEDVPDQLVRTPLQRAVQLLKRHRDVRFFGHEFEAEKPISIILTTLAASAYRQETDVFSTLANMLDQIQRYQDTGIIRCIDGEWVIENPTNPGENFADRWNDEGSRRADAFFEWIDWLREDLDDLLNADTHKSVRDILIRSFGDAPGKRVSNAYTGQPPGAQKPAMSRFRRVAGRVLRFDVAHKEQPRWHVSPTAYQAAVKAKYRRKGFRPTAFRSNSSPLPKHVSIDFKVETNVPKPYRVYWQVVNTGNEAGKAGQLRGDFYESSSSGKSRSEATAYEGMHWVEGFVVKDNLCVARTGEFVVNVG